MSTTHEVCSNCGATITPAEVGAVVHCEYCGTENRVVASAERGAPVVHARAQIAHATKHAERERLVETLEARRMALTTAKATSRAPLENVPAASLSSATRSSKKGCFFALAAIAAAIAIVVMLTKKSGTSTVKPSELHTMTLSWLTHVPIEPPARNLKYFDPLKYIEWATDVGRGWWDDAALKKITADPIMKDGTIDLTKDNASVQYELVSTACMNDLRKRKETTNPAEITCHLRIDVTTNGTSVSMALVGAGDDLATIVDPPCTVAKVFERIAADGHLPPRRTYSFRVFGKSVAWSVGHGVGSAPFEQGDTQLPYTFCLTPR